MKLPEPIEEFLYEPPVAPVIWPRRLFHLLLGSTLPIGILLLPIDLSEWLLIAASMAAVLAEVLRGLLGSVNDWMVRRLPFFKASERWQITGATYMWLSATFPGVRVRQGHRCAGVALPLGGAIRSRR